MKQATIVEALPQPDLLGPVSWRYNSEIAVLHPQNKSLAQDAESPGFDALAQTQQSGAGRSGLTEMHELRHVARGLVRLDDVQDVDARLVFDAAQNGVLKGRSLGVI